MQSRQISYFFSLFLGLSNVYASDIKPTDPILKDIAKTMVEFTKEPHPIGSKRQLHLADKYASIWKKRGAKIELQTFSAKTPNTRHILLGGKESQKKWTEKKGVNVIGTLPGTKNCAVVIGGHFDTKPYTQFRFVGANDGGSSTALLMALPLLLKKKNADKKIFSLSQCDLHMVLFDGEEAQLPNWGTGQRLFGKRDNLYGSFRFVRDYVSKKNNKIYIKEKPLYLSIIVDMIGHKKQKLNITMGSHDKSEALLKKVSKGIHYADQRPPIEDDHLPFMQAGSKVLHIIDWNNLKEWHTPKDTLDIISNENIYRFTHAISRFLQEPTNESDYL